MTGLEYSDIRGTQDKIYVPNGPSLLYSRTVKWTCNMLSTSWQFLWHQC